MGARLPSQQQLSRFSRYLWLTLGMFVVFAAAVVLYARSEQQVGRASEVWRQSHTLADELRKSSDDLTRMVRTYAATGAPLYKQHYQEILEIRDGTKPRPLAYDDVYWDLVLADNQRPRPPGPAVPLLDLMRKAGFTEEEFARLADAKANSDALTKIEFAAMALIEAANPPAGARSEAIRMLHDAAYHQRKAGIMRPISEFQTMADERMRQAVDAAEAHATRMLVALILCGLVLAFLLWSTRRSLHAVLGGPVDELSARIDVQRKQAQDEVSKRTSDLEGSMLASLNMMEDAVNQRENAERAYAELERTHQQLVEASRQRGMAEVATNVLHNVGNVLNSVNVSASLVTDSIKSAPGASMARVAALLREHESDLGSYITSDPKGRHIPALLEELAQGWLARQEVVVKELESLRTNIDHIKEIVAMQQSHARVKSAPEMVSIGDLVEESLRMNASGLVKDHVRIVREFEPVAPVSVEKHKVLQILINLVRNAKHACEGLADDKKRMTLRIAELDGRIRVSVSDNGAGIAAENLTRIFSHGFTTRKDGHGFGLHSGALAAAELGGSLSAHSDGPGRGATFTLEFGTRRGAAAA
jgi:signal transduction histidine kinase